MLVLQEPEGKPISKVTRSFPTVTYLFCLTFLNESLTLCTSSETHLRDCNNFYITSTTKGRKPDKTILKQPGTSHLSTSHISSGTHFDLAHAEFQGSLPMEDKGNFRHFPARSTEAAPGAGQLCPRRGRLTWNSSPSSSSTSVFRASKPRRQRSSWFSRARSHVLSRKSWFSRSSFLFCKEP